jgi:hypothetical protein
MYAFSRVALQKRGRHASPRCALPQARYVKRKTVIGRSRDVDAPV